MADATTLANFTSHLAALGYFAGVLSLLGDKQGQRQRLALLLGLVAALMHTADLLSTFLQYHSISSSFYDAISLTALIVVIATLIAQRQQPSRVVLVPLYLVAMLSVLLSIYLGQYHPIHAPSTGILVHIISSITAYALLCVAALYAGLVLVTDARLKNHQQLWAISLPPLQQTESTLFHTLNAGWLMLSVAIASGFLYIDNLFAQHLLHKTVFTLLSWLVFSGLLLGHHLRGWRGRTAAGWTIGGFIALVLAYLGSKFVLDVVLGRL